MVPRNINRREREKKRRAKTLKGEKKIQEREKESILTHTAQS